VTPQITPEGNVILSLDITKDSPDTLTAFGYTISTKQITTQVLVENGGTVVIGGIYTLTESEGETRVPILGDVPVVGNLFKSKQRSVVKSELLIFVTPRTISDRGALR
jgi:type IV pilus assembly protein PilQ